MASRFDTRVEINSLDDLYKLQQDIMALACNDVKLHFISDHICVEDKNHFLDNAMEQFKCIMIDPRSDPDIVYQASRMAKIMKNQMRYKIEFFCPLCNHQTM